MNYCDICNIAIQKLQTEIDALKAEFAATKERLDHLEATVNHEE